MQKRERKCRGLGTACPTGAGIATVGTALQRGNTILFALEQRFSNQKCAEDPFWVCRGDGEPHEVCRYVSHCRTIYSCGEICPHIYFYACLLRVSLSRTNAVLHRKTLNTFYADKLNVCHEAKPLFHFGSKVWQRKKKGVSRRGSCRATFGNHCSRENQYSSLIDTLYVTSVHHITHDILEEKKYIYRLRCNIYSLHYVQEQFHKHTGTIPHCKNKRERLHKVSVP